MSRLEEGQGREASIEIHNFEGLHPSENLGFARLAWGDEVTNDLLLDRFSGVVDRSEEIIAGTKINMRHHPQDFVTGTFFEHRDRINQEMVEAGGAVGREALGDKKADIVIVSSSLPPDSTGDWGWKVAKGVGSPEAEVRYSYLACAGAGVAFHDMLQQAQIDGELRDKTVLIVAVEPLGYVLGNRPGDFATKVIFDTGAAAMALRPGDWELLAGKTEIIPDEEGVILLPKTYDLMWEERIEVPEWYEVDKEAAKVFAYTESGVAMAMPESTIDKGLVSMKNKKTAFLFRDVVPPVVVGVSLEAKENHGVEVDLGVFHQPSRVPLRQIDLRRLNNRMLSDKGLRELRIPWVLDDIGMGNTSSATTLMALQEMFRRGEIKRGEAFNITSFGIGLAVTSMVVKWLGGEQGR